jgi:hypothetical protein
MIKQKNKGKIFRPINWSSTYFPYLESEHVDHVKFKNHQKPKECDVTSFVYKKWASSNYL